MIHAQADGCVASQPQDVEGSRHRQQQPAGDRVGDALQGDVAGRSGVRLEGDPHPEQHQSTVSRQLAALTRLDDAIDERLAALAARPD